MTTIREDRSISLGAHDTGFRNPEITLSLAFECPVQGADLLSLPPSTYCPVIGLYTLSPGSASLLLGEALLYLVTVAPAVQIAEGGRIISSVRAVHTATMFEQPQPGPFPMSATIELWRSNFFEGVQRIHGLDLAWRLEEQRRERGVQTIVEQILRSRAFSHAEYQDRAVHTYMSWWNAFIYTNLRVPNEG